MNDAKPAVTPSERSTTRHQIQLVGLEQFDEEHRTLAAYIAELQECVANDNAGPNVIPILRSVYNYAAEHFSHEEAAMESWGYPGLEDHRLEHQILIGRLRRLLEETSFGGTVLSSAVIEILAEWIMEHVELYDLGYADFYNKGYIVGH